MNRYLYFFIALIFAGSLAFCGSSKASRSTAQRPHIDIMSWNEDTLNPYQFGYYSDSTFTYYIPDQNNPGTGSMLRGTVIKDVFDTFFLKYRNDSQPNFFTNYLIRERSGNYLIQPLKDKPDRIYLRIISRLR